AQLAARSGGSAAPRARALDRHQGQLVVETSRLRGKYRARRALTLAVGQSCWISLASETEVGAASPPAPQAGRRVERWTPRLERFFGTADMQRLLAELRQDI